MKILILSTILLLSVSLAFGLRPPTPYCRSAPLPSLVPIAINTTSRFDLQNVFDGYNLQIKGPQADHIDVVPKYTVSNHTFNQSYNFIAAKVKLYDRFMGLVETQFTSSLAIGSNNNFSGVAISMFVQIESQPNIHCYDVDEVISNGQYLAMVDCAHFHEGQLVYNEFMFIDLYSGRKILGGKTHDAFVQYNHLSKRNIEVIADPVTRLNYVIRVIPRDGVDKAHENQTYVELFLLRNPLDPEIIDVIDHTSLELPYLSIAQYQVALGRIYILAYNKAMYEIEITKSQRLRIRSKFQVKLDITRFFVDRLGINDDLIVVMTNGNHVYKYEWDVTSAPRLQQKYGLIANSRVEQIVCNTDFIIVTATAEIDNKWDRQHWVFTKNTLSYTHAYSVFEAPDDGPAIMQWDNNEAFLHLFHAYNSYNFRLSLPYMEIKPVSSSKAGTNETYTVTATSTSNHANETKTCQEKFTFYYQLPNDTKIIKTGFYDNYSSIVSSPDQIAIPLMFEFFGMNLSYNISFETNSSIIPYAYVDKIHKAVFNHVQDIDPADIVFYEMFIESINKEIAPEQVLGLIQVEVKNSTANATKEYITHYVECKINVFDRDDTHHLNCRIISSMKFTMGKILKSSQMFDPLERRIALVFEDIQHSVFIYQFWAVGFGFWGRKDYAGDAWSSLTGVAISNGKLFCTLQYSKRVEIFNLQDLYSADDQPVNSTAMFVIDSTVTSYFGITYFAPIDIKISKYHSQVIFIRSKTGVIITNINEQAQPQILYKINAQNAKYDFQVNHDSLLMIHEDQSELYHLYTPLRRTLQPYLRQIIPYKFTIGQYDEIIGDRLFYLVGVNNVFVINPSSHSNNAVYSHLKFPQNIINIDAVNIKDRQVLFIHTKTQMYAYVIREDPMLFIEWTSNTFDFNISLTAYNDEQKSNPYSFMFEVLQNNDTVIKPTEHFKESEVKKLGHVKAHENQNRTFTFNVTLNDSNWFQGNVFRYSVNCSNCGKGKNIEIENHIEEVGQLVTGRAIYDMESTFNGIYAQQYASYIKTWGHNDSIKYIQNIPVQNRGQVCSKIIPSDNGQYVVSLCQDGQQVNAYVTTLLSDKPFTIGPYATEAKAVTSAKLVDDILMIVDNEDNPYLRQGAVYLYSLNLEDQVEMVLIDQINNQDLRIEGYHGMGNIASADLHEPHGIDEYRIFITDAKTGHIFIFSFQLSPSRHEVIYLSKKMLQLKNYIPEHIKAPHPLNALTIHIHYYMGNITDLSVKYFLIVTMLNFHHFELEVDIARTDQIKKVQLLRMFQRIPWHINNILRLKRGWQFSQLAVNYVSTKSNQQVVAIYQADYIVNAVMQGTYKTYGEDGLVHIPLVGILGVHRVDDIYEVAFAFHSRGLDTLLFTDVDGYNITELTINQNITLAVRDLANPQDVSITAHSPYNNFTFTVQVRYQDQETEEKVEIIWIIIVGIGCAMIIGLIVVYGKQKSDSNKKNKVTKYTKQTKAPVEEGKQSLITVEDKYKEEYINRTSVDPESIRGTIDMRIQPEVEEEGERKE